MTEPIRALVVILMIACTALVMTRPAMASLMPAAAAQQRRNTWLLLTLLAFLSHSFWIFALGSALLLSAAYRREHNVPALFWLLLFVVPPVAAKVPGLGLINFLIDLNFQRMLVLIVLVPCAAHLARDPKTHRLGRFWPDRFLLAYLALSAILVIRHANLTQVLRESFYLITDVGLPYYVFSRGLHNIQRIKDAMATYVLAAVLLALIGLFEMLKHWLLYAALPGAWGLSGTESYLRREGLLRASASTGQAIVLGYLIAIGCGFYFGLSQDIARTRLRMLGWLTLLGGLVAPLSRGPWVGAAVTAAVYVATGPHGLRRLMLVGLGALAVSPLLPLFPFGQKIISLLPFVGDVEMANITYRERLIENARILIDQNFWLGMHDYRERLASMGMVQGQGIVDVVNTYVQVALELGVLGLALFSGFFGSVVLGLKQAISIRRKRAGSDDETLRVGRSLLAALLGVLLMIATVSSISFIPWVYWTLAGAAVGYSQVVGRALRSPDMGTS